MRLSLSVTSLDFLAGPAITLLTASLISFIVMSFLSALAAKIADSLRIFSISAPVKPEVSLARDLKLISDASGLLRE